MAVNSGPVTKNVETVPLGLAQIRVGNATDNISDYQPALTSSESIGALANTKFTTQKDFFTLESGFPLREDKTYTLREKAMLECAFKELNPFNLGLAMGQDPTSGTGGSNLSETISGEILLGTSSAPSYVRMEAVYTYPDQTSTMTIIFPYSQVTSPAEIDLQAEDTIAAPLTFESKRADGQSATWANAPLGRVVFSS